MAPKRNEREIGYRRAIGLMVFVVLPIATLFATWLNWLQSSNNFANHLINNLILTFGMGIVPGAVLGMVFVYWWRRARWGLTSHLLAGALLGLSVVVVMTLLTLGSLPLVIEWWIPLVGGAGFGLLYALLTWASASRRFNVEDQSATGIRALQ